MLFLCNLLQFSRLHLCNLLHLIMKFLDLPHFVSETRVKERFDEISLGNERLEFACSMTMSYVLLITDIRVILLDHKKLSFKSAPILRAEILDFEIVEKKKSNLQT